MGAKYFVFAGGRWCEVDARSGRVAGARARFLSMRRGRLQLAASSAVLRGLRALAAGRPSDVRDGPPLPYKRRRRRSARAHSRCAGCRHHCCGVQDSRTIEQAPVERAQTGDAAPGVPCAAAAGAPPHAEDVAREPHRQNKRRPMPRSKRKRSDSSSSEPTPRRAFLAPVPAPTSTPASEHARVPASTSAPGPTSASARAPAHSSSSNQQEPKVKELIIREEDVAVYRAYLAAHEPAFDARRFDSDEAYKLRAFFRINPLVSVERCARADARARARRDAALRDFATKLGLRSVSDCDSDPRKRYKMRSRSAKLAPRGDDSEDTDKENQARGLPAPRQLGGPGGLREKVAGVMSSGNAGGGKGAGGALTVSSTASSGTDRDFAKKPRFVTKKPQKKSLAATCGGDLQKKKWRRVEAGGRGGGGGGGREYSPLEDQAIVAWVSAGRARAVNGNRIWRELQDSYERITGTGRSWHSLRNRYLRYILPALGRLALSPQQARLLRAAAARGEIKRSSLSQRRNSLLHHPRVMSAWARRPRGRARSSSSSRSRSRSRTISASRSRSASMERALARAGARSGAGAQPRVRADDSERVLRTRTKDNNESMVTGHMSPPAASADSPRSPRRALRSSAANNTQTRTPAYARVARQNRNTARAPSTDSDAPLDPAPAPAPAPAAGGQAADSPKPETRRTRKLYNPR